MYPYIHHSCIKQRRNACQSREEEEQSAEPGRKRYKPEGSVPSLLFQLSVSTQRTFGFVNITAPTNSSKIYSTDMTTSPLRGIVSFVHTPRGRTSPAQNWHMQSSCFSPYDWCSHLWGFVRVAVSYLAKAPAEKRLMTVYQTGAIFLYPIRLSQAESIRPFRPGQPLLHDEEYRRLLAKLAFYRRVPVGKMRLLQIHHIRCILKFIYKFVNRQFNMFFYKYST